MKKIVFSFLLFACIGGFSQNNLVVFSENGEKFQLVINGVNQNAIPETNVKVTDLIQPNYKVKIVFEDKSKGVVNQNVYMADGGEPVKNHEFVYSVKSNAKGVYKVRPVSMVAISETKSDPSQTVVHYTTVDPSGSGNSNVVTNSNSSNTTNNNVVVNQSTSQTNTGSNTGTNNTNANVGINMNGMGVGINVNITDNMGDMGGSSNTTVTSQTITTSSSGYQNNNNTNIQASGNNSTNAGKNTSGKGNRSNNALPGYSGPVGCAMPMGNTEFGKVKLSISEKSFEDSKLKIAKQVIDNNCLLSSQVKEIMLLFSFEQTRLDLAKYAYGHTYDIGNYYQLNDAFTFESSIDELDNYIKKTNNK